jgi:hypothetical protein
MLGLSVTAARERLRDLWLDRDSAFRELPAFWILLNNQALPSGTVL